MFICPKCKSVIKKNKCTNCNFILTYYKRKMPVFFSDTKISKKYKEIGAFYDNLYNKIEDTWHQIADRGPEFINYVSKIISENTPIRYIDIGCGEGHLLAAVEADEKYGIEISFKASEVTATKTKANICIGFSEEMPFTDNFFDTVSSIGVMTHFIDDVKATEEIYRILKNNGKYILGIYLKPQLFSYYYSKGKEKITKLTSPIDLIKLLNKKIKEKINYDYNKLQSAKQPIERIYSKKELLKILKNTGFHILEEITKQKKPDAPLPGYHFRIYILKK